MLETWNPKLNVIWSADEKAVLDAAVELSTQSGQASYLEDIIRFLHEHSGADIVMICRKTDLPGELQTLQVLIKGQLMSGQQSYAVEATPCAKVNRYGVLYFRTGVQALFPEDTFLKDNGINSYFGAPLLDPATDELIGIVAILHHQPLENPSLLEFVLTILSPSLEARLEAHA